MSHALWDIKTGIYTLGFEKALKFCIIEQKELQKKHFGENENLIGKFAIRWEFETADLVGG